VSFRSGTDTSSPHALFPDNLDINSVRLRIDIVANSSNRCGRMCSAAGDEVHHDAFR